MLSSPQNAGTAYRFAREKYFPSDWNSGADTFCSLFNRYGYIYKPLEPGSTWLSADEKWQLTDTEILKAIACAHPKYILGTRASKATRFAVLDIDAKSKYHSLPELNRIRALLKKAGIAKTNLFRSSRSGGWHLYIFFDEAISSRDLNRQLTLLLLSNDFSIKQGQLEIFPSPGEAGSLGHGLRLPLQPGWAWLNPNTLDVDIERDEINALEALDMFLFDLRNASNQHHDYHQLKRYVQDSAATRSVSAKKQPASNKLEARKNVVAIKRDMEMASEQSKAFVQKTFGAFPPGINADTWVKGREYFEKGLSGESQRADAIFSLSHYFFYGDPQNAVQPLGYGCEQDRQRSVEQAISSQHNGFSKDINDAHADAYAQVERATHWRPEAKVAQIGGAFIAEVPVSWVLENERRKNFARMRIAQAVSAFRKSKQSFTAADLQRQTKCSWSTIYKHQDLWKENHSTVSLSTISEYEQIADDIFAISTDEYNAVGDLFLLDFSSALSAAAGSSVAADSGSIPTGQSVSEMHAALDVLKHGAILRPGLSEYPQARSSLLYCSMLDETTPDNSFNQVTESQDSRVCYGQVGMNLNKSYVWQKEDPIGMEYCRIKLDEQGFHASGVAMGKHPQFGIYSLDFELETDSNFLTTKLFVESEVEDRRIDLLLCRSSSGIWRASSTRSHDCGFADLDPELLSKSLDCDLGLSPLTNSMPVLRHQLLSGGDPVELCMVWVSVPDLKLRLSKLVYSLVKSQNGVHTIRYQSDNFSADIDFDSDGLVLSYPGLARRL